MLAYFLSKYGIGFRERCLTNTLISFVSKEELYAIPIPLPSKMQQRRIGDLARQAITQHRNYKDKIREAEELLAGAIGLADLDVSPSTDYTRNISDLRTSHQFGAEYFMPCKQRALIALADMPGQLLGELFYSARDIFQPKEVPPTRRLRNFDLTDALEPVLDDEASPTVAAEVGSTKKILQFDDVVISRLRSYLRQIALIRTSSTLPAVGSSEFIVLRSRKSAGAKGPLLSPEVLLIFLRSLPVQTILKWSQDGSQHPRFAEEELLAIPVPDAVLKIASEAYALVRDALEKRTNSTHLLQEAKVALERLVIET